MVVKLNNHRKFSKIKFRNLRNLKFSLCKQKKFHKFLSQWDLGIFHHFSNPNLKRQLKISISKILMKKKKQQSKNKNKKKLSRKKCQQFSDLFFQQNKKPKFSPKISLKADGSFETLNKSVKTNTKRTKRDEGTVSLEAWTIVPPRMSMG